MSTTLFQFKGVNDTFEYSSVDYPEVYIITQATWVVLDLSILSFGHLLDLVSKVYMNAIYTINRPDLFDYFEIRLSQAIENAANIDALTRQTVKDEGNVVGNVRTFNFVGEGVTATLDPSDIDGTTALITIPSGGLNLLLEEDTGEGWATEYDGAFQELTVRNSQYANIAEWDPEVGLTLNFSGVNNKAGFVCITNITPTSPSDNVGSYEYDASGIAMTSCRSSTVNVDIEVLAITGLQDLKPVVIVNGSYVTLTQHTTENLWKGTVSRVLVESMTPGEYLVEAYHSEGNTDTAIVYLETPPIVTVAEYTGNYPNALSGQTSYVNGRTVGFTVTADKAFTHLEVVADADCGLAYKALNPPELVAPFTEYTTRTGSALTVAVATNAVYTKHLKVRVKNANTTDAWSAPFATTGTTDHVNLIKLDSRLPVASIGTIGYPGTQQALKLVEATDPITVTYTNVEAITLSSPNGELTLSGTLGGGTVTATRIAPGIDYNVTDVNLSILAKRLTNDTQSTSTAVVLTANNAPTITMSVNLGVRLRSGPDTGIPYTVTLSAAPQRLNIAPTVVASGGELTGAWTSADNGITWTRTIRIRDTDTRGAKTFNTLLATNLAGVTQNVIDTGEDYEIGGFVSRSGTFPATTAYVDIGVAASGFNNAAKIVATIGNIACTYAPDTLDVPYVFGANHTITTVSTASPTVHSLYGNALRLNEAATVAANAGGGLPYTIEELA